MKKAIALFLSLMTVLTVSGCGSSAPEAAQPQEPAAAVQPQEPAAAAQTQETEENAPEQEPTPAPTATPAPTPTPYPGTTEDGLSYEMYSDHVIITGCDEKATSVTVPETIEGKPVTGIGDGAFERHIPLNSVSLPESITSIGDSAFAWSTRLADLNIPDSVTDIGDFAFAGCQFLREIHIPASLETIGRYVYYYSSPTVLSIPEGVKVIGDHAFAECDHLTSISLPDTVTEIGEGAFNDCDNLASFHIPDSVESIGDAAFGECPRLKEFSVDASPYFSTVDGVLFSADGTQMISFPIGRKSPTYSIPEGVTTICDHAFTTHFILWYAVTKIDIPASVTNIGEYAFDLPCLEEFSVAGDNPSYSSLDGVLFNKDQTELIAYPNSKTGDYSIPEGVTRIGDRAMFTSFALSRLTIPASVTSIGVDAFPTATQYDYAASLKFNKPILRDITVDSANPQYSSVDGMLYSKDQTQLLVFPAGRPGDNQTIPEGTTSIAYHAFFRCRDLKRITIPEGVTSIENNAFTGCWRLISARVPVSLQSIGEDAFSSCFDLATFQYAGTQEQWERVSVGEDALPSDLTVYYES